MRRTLTTIAIIGLLLTASGAWASTASAIRRKHHSKHAVKAVLPPPAPVPVVPPPLYPMHQAAVPPKVTYEGGNLTIDARNSTLSDVLKSVEKLTGASFEISSGDTSERVVGRIGPGSARDVLATLLNGSHFNYVMLSPVGSPSALSRVLLTPRGAALAQNNASPQQPQQFQQPVQISPALQVQQQNATADESADNGDTPEENADAQDQDQTNGQPDAQTDPAQAGQQPPQPGVKTPEQLLQELRQQQQQVIQQQQGPQPGQVPDDNK